MRENPKNVKRLSSHQCLFALLGSLYKKAAHKQVGEIGPRCKRKWLIKKVERVRWI